MARRGRLKIRSAEVRVKSYYAGTDTGALKYRNKRPLMKIHYLGVARFTTEVNNIVKSVLDENGYVGFDRALFHSAALRIARFVVKYSSFADDRLLSMVEPIIAEQAVVSGVAGTDMENEFINIMRDIARRIVASKDTLYNAYMSGYEGSLSEREGEQG